MPHQLTTNLLYVAFPKASRRLLPLTGGDEGFGVGVSGGDPVGAGDGVLQDDQDIWVRTANMHTYKTNCV